MKILVGFLDNAFCNAGNERAVNSEFEIFKAFYATLLKNNILHFMVLILPMCRP